MKNRISYGINTQNRNMYPYTKELSQTVAVCHRVATVTYGFNYLAGVQSRKPWIKDIAMALKAGRQDGCVCFNKRKRCLKEDQ